jgi:hypothetical protein
VSIDLEQDSLLARLRFVAWTCFGFPGASINPDSFQCAPADGASAIPLDQG